MSNLMCDDLELARLNRERVAKGYCNHFYDEQAKALAQWEWGGKPPVGLILGELPYVGINQIRLDRD